MIANILTNEAMARVPESYKFKDGRYAVRPSLEMMAVDGWREVQSIEEPANGLRVTEYRAVEMVDGKCRLEIVKSEPIPEATDEPIIQPQIIQGRFETPADDGHVYGLEVVPETGAVIAVQRQSKRLTNTEYQAAKRAKLESARKVREEGIAGINGQLQARIERIERALGWRT
jgi:hypothetical protein